MFQNIILVTCGVMVCFLLWILVKNISRGLGLIGVVCYSNKLKTFATQIAMIENKVNQGKILTIGELDFLYSLKDKLSLGKLAKFKPFLTTIDEDLLNNVLERLQLMLSALETIIVGHVNRYKLETTYSLGSKVDVVDMELYSKYMNDDYFKAFLTTSKPVTKEENYAFKATLSSFNNLVCYLSSGNKNHLLVEFVATAFTIVITIFLIFEMSLPLVAKLG